MRNIREKENAAPDFMAMIRKSWTWDRLTDEERTRFENLIGEITFPHFDGRIRGNYISRWNQLQNVYNAFLTALDYAPIGWREPETEEPVPLF